MSVQEPTVSTRYKEFGPYLSPAKPPADVTQAAQALAVKQGRSWCAVQCSALSTNLCRDLIQLKTVIHRILTAVFNLGTLFKKGHLDYRNNEALMTKIHKDVVVLTKHLNQVSKNSAWNQGLLKTESKSWIGDMRQACDVLKSTVGARKADVAQLAIIEKEVADVKTLRKQLHTSITLLNPPAPPATKTPPSSPLVVIIEEDEKNEEPNTPLLRRSEGEGSEPKPAKSPKPTVADPIAIIVVDAEPKPASPVLAPVAPNVPPAEVIVIEVENEEAVDNDEAAGTADHEDQVDESGAEADVDESPVERGVGAADEEEHVGSGSESDGESSSANSTSTPVKVTPKAKPQASSGAESSGNEDVSDQEEAIDRSAALSPAAGAAAAAASTLTPRDLEIREEVVTLFRELVDSADDNGASKVLKSNILPPTPGKPWLTRIVNTIQGHKKTENSLLDKFYSTDYTSDEFSNEEVQSAIAEGLALLEKGFKAVSIDDYVAKKAYIEKLLSKLGAEDAAPAEADEEIEEAQETQADVSPKAAVATAEADETLPVEEDSSTEELALAQA